MKRRQSGAGCAAAAALTAALVATSAATLVTGSNAWSQAFPTKRILVASTASPGSSGDAALRLMAIKMTESMGQPVIVELHTAARGAQAYAIVGKAVPDGHTITFGTAGTYVYGRFLFKNMAFDILKDYAPISMTFNSPAFVTIHSSLNINTIPELIDYAKKNPGKLEYASTGNGSFFHLAGEALKDAAGINLLHIPYAQANFPQLQIDWASGRVAMWFPTWANVGPNQGKTKVLATIDKVRDRHFPDVPAIQEVLPKYKPFVVWWGFFGPVALPKPIANRIAAEAKKSMQSADVQKRMDELGLVAIGSTPDELASLLREDIDAIGGVVKAIGLQPE